MTKRYDLAVFIGRFQPFHNGHLAVVEQGLKIAERVLILVGSSNRRPDTRNPFTYDQRRDMIKDTLFDLTLARIANGSGDPTKLDGAYADLIKRIEIKALPDSGDPVWIADVQHAVKRAANTQVAPRVTIIGHERDETSGYLRWFPTWSYEAVEDTSGINATAIRELALANMGPENEVGITQGIRKLPVSSAVADFLITWRKTPQWEELRAERDAEHDYKQRWGDKEPHLTADAVVIQSGHVLVIRRGNYPGKGALALPGGFKDRGETLFQAACRELREETKLNLSDAWLQGHLIGSDVFDDPLRSRRGEIVTRAFFFSFPDGPLPAVRGGDDAAEALWLPISEVRVDNLFEDHAFLIQRALAQLERKP